MDARAVPTQNSQLLEDSPSSGHSNEIKPLIIANQPRVTGCVGSPVLLCSASSEAICMRASSTRALSSHVYQSSSSCRKLEAPVASDTFLVASLHRRSMKPGMFSSATSRGGRGTAGGVVRTFGSIGSVCETSTEF